MKKRILSVLLAMVLVLSSSVTVFASDQSSNLSSLDPSSLGPSTSLQLMFAKLQMAQAETANQQALEKMDEIQKIQDEQKLIAQFLNTARQCRAEAKDTETATEMPADIADYMDENGLVYDTTGNDLLMTAEEWDVAITSLETRLEELGAETQQEMVYLQDFMGQYNSYLQGANTQISNSNQTLTSLARGQSMYGDSEVGLAVTGLVLGLVLGCAATLAVQKVRRKKDAV